MTEAAAQFSQHLQLLINGGCITKSDILLSGLCDFPIKKLSRKVHSLYHNTQESFQNNSQQLHEVCIEPYSGTNHEVQTLAEYLQQHLCEELLGAYVHGSLGTYEEIAYSDMDALVILKDRVFSSPDHLYKTARLLNKARAIMFRFDPLQHHGWFVMAERDLRCYPQHYFPWELFPYSKSLLKRQQKLSLWVSTSQQQPLLQHLANSIITTVQQQKYPKNVYELKNLLSGFMLLPCCYVEAKEKLGIYKKYSFAKARQDFSPEQWGIMDQVSQIRQMWHYPISRMRRYFLTRPNQFSRYLVKNYAPAIPHDIQQYLTTEFYQKMADLAQCMVQKWQTNE